MNNLVNSNSTQSTIAASRNYQEALQLWNGNNNYRNIAALISSNITVLDSFAEKAGGFIGEKLVAKVYDKQYFNPVYGKFKNFLSRNIYISKSKRDLLEKQRYAAGYAASAVTESGIKLVSRGIANWADKRDRFITLNDLHKFLYSYSKQDIKNINEERGFIELAKIRSAFPISAKEKAKIRQDSQESSLPLERLMDNCSFMSGDNDELRRSISYMLFAIHCQMFGDSYNDETVLKYLMNYYNILGFHDKYAKELLRENTETYKSVTDDQVKYLKLARNFIQNVFIEIPEIDADRLSEQAKKMAAYDPYSIRRKKVQNVVKAGGQTIVGLYHKNPQLVIQAAGTAFSQLDLEDNSDAGEFIYNLFKKKGIEDKDISAMIECSNCINDISDDKCLTENQLIF